MKGHYFKWPPPNASHFLVVGSRYTVCSWSPFAGWLLQCLLESFWNPCDSSAVAVQVAVWYIHMSTTTGTRSVIVNANWDVQLWEFYIGKKIYRHTESFSTTGFILDMEGTCRRPVLIEEKWTEFVVKGDIPKKILAQLAQVWVHHSHIM